jgi:LysM repeat protein
MVGFSQTLNPTYQAYIEKFHAIAIKQQKEHGIPASIILAQGLLESGAGRGILATEANNHFGIKCHDWTGKKIYKDDDEKNECFRKYRHAEESYEDHSLFLVNRPRYSSLFLLNPTDYVSWAHGLKAAGYATDPAYAQKLINLIERYGLHQYDIEKKGLFATKTDLQTQSERRIYKSNYLRIVVATDDDTYASLAEELKISEKRLRKYNEVGTETQLKKGDIVYLSKKKKTAARVNHIHVVQPGETLYGISQIYGIQLINLYKMNDIPFTQGAYIGQIIKLR